MSVVPQRLKIWGILFCPVCHFLIIILQFFKSVNRSETFNLANNFLTMSSRALIFHMSISCDRTFPWVPTCYHVTLTLEFDLLVLFENINLVNEC